MGSNYIKNSKTINSLRDEGIISQETARVFSKGKDINVKIPPLGRRGDPIYQCILIDSSGSMRKCKEAVINSQPIMIDALRESTACKQKRLFINQYLFDTEPHQLHSFTKLSSDKSDDVVLLNTKNYNPRLGTALKKTVFSVLQELSAVIQHANSQGAFARFGITIITDGRDGDASVKSSDIRRFLKEMSQTEHLLNSVVVGLLGKALSKNGVEEIRETLGFMEAIPCEQNSARKIRRAFVLASQSCLQPKG